MIRFENVTKTYNKTVRALDDVSFNVKGGEIVGFIGPNGSGKTTTMKLLTGIIRPDSGKIIVNKYNIREDPIKVKQSIGYIADNPDMFLRLKGSEFLELIGDIYNDGIVLTGGASQIVGMDTLIKIATDLRVTIADDPADCVVRGCGEAIKYIDGMKRSDGSVNPITDRF